MNRIEEVGDVNDEVGDDEAEDLDGENLENGE